jgi:hypothetical protein
MSVRKKRRVDRKRAIHKAFSHIAGAAKRKKRPISVQPLQFTKQTETSSK